MATINKTFHVSMNSQELNEEWKKKQVMRENLHDVCYWDSHAKMLPHKHSSDAYADRFLKFAQIQKGESVFDMGCGLGNLAIPLACTNHEVTAADFSKGMLMSLQERVKDYALDNLTLLQLSWEENWKAAHVEPQSFDISLASRSLSTNDLRLALWKLTVIARRRVCATIAHNASPRMDDEMLEEIGISVSPSQDDDYAIAILEREGFSPDVHFIDDKRMDTFKSFDDAFDTYFKMAKAACQQTQTDLSDSVIAERVRDWLKHNLVSSEKSTNRPLRLKRPRHTIWSFISWDKQ